MVYDKFVLCEYRAVHSCLFFVAHLDLQIKASISLTYSYTALKYHFEFETLQHDAVEKAEFIYTIR